MQQLSDTTKRQPASALACASALLDALPDVMWFVRRNMRRHRTAGLSVPQFRALVFIDTYPSSTLSALAEHLGATLPTASRIISGLVQKKLVRRAGGAHDRRKLSLALTPRGRKIQLTARRATEEQVAKVLRRSSDRDRAKIAEGLALLGALFEGSVAAAESRLHSAKRES